MTPHPIDHVCDRLESYADAIRGIEVHLDQPDTTHGLFASPAYREKHRIPILISAITFDESVQRRLKSRYDQLTSELLVLELRHERELRERLLFELKYFVDSWHAGLCHHAVCTMDPGDVGEFPHREMIGILLEELQGDAEIPGIAQMVCMLEEATRSMDFSGPRGTKTLSGARHEPESLSLQHRPGIREA